MTTTAAETGIETSVLEGLDFEICCQRVTIYRSEPDIEHPACGHEATHTAKVHNLVTCQWVDKFLCEECLRGFTTTCWECGITPRIIDIAPIWGNE